MNNKNFTNPIYKKLFPETYAKHLKLQAALDSIREKWSSPSFMKSNVEELSMNKELHNAG